MPKVKGQRPQSVGCGYILYGLHKDGRSKDPDQLFRYMFPQEAHGLCSRSKIKGPKSSVGGTKGTWLSTGVGVFCKAK